MLNPCVFSQCGVVTVPFSSWSNTDFCSVLVFLCLIKVLTKCQSTLHGSSFLFVRASSILAFCMLSKASTAKASRSFGEPCLMSMACLF